MVVDATGDRVLFDQRSTNSRVGVPIRTAPLEQIPVDAVGGQFVCRQIYAPTLQILGDVAEKSGEHRRTPVEFVAGVHDRVL